MLNISNQLKVIRAHLLAFFGLVGQLIDQIVFLILQNQHHLGGFMKKLLDLQELGESLLLNALDRLWKLRDDHFVNLLGKISKDFASLVVSRSHESSSFFLLLLQDSKLSLFDSGHFKIKHLFGELFSFGRDWLV